jgi:hypothetical protein
MATVNKLTQSGTLVNRPLRFYVFSCMIVGAEVVIAMTGEGMKAAETACLEFIKSHETAMVDMASIVMLPVFSVQTNQPLDTPVFLSGTTV